MVDPRKDYQYNIIVENANANDTFERDLFRDFRNAEHSENIRLSSKEQVLVYSSPIVAEKS